MLPSGAYGERQRGASEEGERERGRRHTTRQPLEQPRMPPFAPERGRPRQAGSAPVNVESTPRERDGRPTIAEAIEVTEVEPVQRQRALGAVGVFVRVFRRTGRTCPRFRLPPVERR